MSLVWLPYADRDDARLHLGPIPDSLDLSFYRGREDEQPPDDIERVEFFVIPAATAMRAVKRAADMPALRFVQTPTSGIDGFLPYLADTVTICNAAGVHDVSMAESAVALILASLHRLDDHIRDMGRGGWNPRFGSALAGKRVLIVGYGHIGRAIEARLQGFEVGSITRVGGHGHAGPPEVHAHEDLPGLLPGADVVVLVAPLTEQTDQMIGAAELDLLPDGALLVNMGRGRLVDTGALVSALAAGRVRAALDTVDPEPLPPAHPLWNQPGVIVTPHAGAMTSLMWPAFDRLVAEQLARYAAGEPPTNIARRGSADVRRTSDREFRSQQ